MALSDVVCSEPWWDTQSVVPSGNKLEKIFFVSRGIVGVEKCGHHWYLRFMCLLGPESLKLGRGVCYTNTNCRLSGFVSENPSWNSDNVLSGLWRAQLKGFDISTIYWTRLSTRSKFYRWQLFFSWPRRWLFSSLFVFPSCPSTILR